MRVILASQSPARLLTLNRAGVKCEVIVSGVDESVVEAPTPAELVMELARLKGHSVVETLGPETDAVVFACDSMLEFEGRAYGKPGTADEARSRWRAMRAGEGVLQTGHYVARLTPGGGREELCRLGSTTVRFADLTDDEIDAYAATGEPQRVAGAFTIDSLGGPYISSIVGDPHNVVGISLPLVRLMLADLGVSWTELRG